MVVAIVVVALISFVFGVVFWAECTLTADKSDVKNGFTEKDGKIYRLVEIKSKTGWDG